MKEDELCNWLIEEAKSRGWTCYPETSSWDILLVRNGVQIGIQAKVRANLKVIYQTLPGFFKYQGASMLSKPEQFRGKVPGPDFRCVLVPSAGIAKDTMKSLHKICNVLGIWTIEMGKSRNHGQPRHFGLGILDDPEQITDFDWHPNEKCWFPEVVPDLPAGVPHPVSMTQWKQKALKLIARAEVNGFVTSKDAKEIDINFQRFKESWKPWMEYVGKEGRIHKYALTGDDPKRPDRQCPEEYLHFLEEARKSKEES